MGVDTERSNMMEDQRELRVLVEEGELSQVCPTCRLRVTPRLSRAGPHIRADCPECGRYLRFCRQEMPEEERRFWDSMKARLAKP